MILHLLRHGESTWNAQRRLQGQTMGVPLTELGRQQAQAAAAELASVPLAAVWSSDQVRAVQTADIIAAPHQLTPRLTPLLREQALGSLAGRLTSELTPEPVPEGQHISEVRWGGGESLADVAVRLRVLLDELRVAHAPDDQVVLVSHGDALRVLLALLDGRTHREVDWVPLPNCGVHVRNLPC